MKSFLGSIALAIASFASVRISLLLLVFISGCTRPVKESVYETTRSTDSVSKSTPELDSNFITRLVEHENHGERIESLDHFYDPAAMPGCKMYERPDTASEVIIEIPPYSGININGKVGEMQDEGIEQIHSPGPWYFVYTNNHKLGYVKEDDIARFVFEGQEGHIKYFIGRHQVWEGVESEVKTRIVRLNTDSGDEDSVDVEYFGEGECMVNELITFPLKGIRKMIVIANYMDFCGGGQSFQFIADAEGKLIKFPSSFVAYDDGGGIDARTVYFPCYTQKGKIELVANALTRDKEILPYPKGIRIPKDELIVVKSEEGAYAVTDDLEPILMKNGQQKIEWIKKTTKYYQWNGKSLRFIKTVTDPSSFGKPPVIN